MENKILSENFAEQYKNIATRVRAISNEERFHRLTFPKWIKLTQQYCWTQVLVVQEIKLWFHTDSHLSAVDVPKGLRIDHGKELDPLWGLPRTYLLCLFHWLLLELVGPRCSLKKCGLNLFLEDTVQDTVLSAQWPCAQKQKIRWGYLFQTKKCISTGWSKINQNGLTASCPRQGPFRLWSTVRFLPSQRFWRANKLAIAGQNYKWWQ